MWVYILLLFVVFVLLLLSIIYLVRFTHNLIKETVSNKKTSWLLSFISLLFFIPGLFIDFVNAIVVDIHLIVIIALVKFIFFIIKKATKKEFKEYIVVCIGIVLTSILMVYGYYKANHVIETDYIVYTDKEIGVDNFRIVQISDSHLGTTISGKELGKYIEDINKLNPDIVVITGDYVDDNTSLTDMVDGAESLGKLKTKYGVYFVYGNHDKGYFNNRSYKDEDIRRELKKNNVTILEDEVVNITDNIILIGRQDKEVNDRKDAVSLTKNLDKSKFIIDLNHQPNDYKKEVEAEMDLVLSGHTHGGQLCPLGTFGIILGSNDKTYGIETRDKTTFIVNSGISGWAIKFKTGSAVSEYTVIDVKNNNNKNNNQEGVKSMKARINDEEYIINLEDNETVKSLINLLPQELKMSELNGNEKYIYLDSSLPTNTSNPKRINAGDVMLYGNNCLVIFYKSFDTSYSYTKIGHIDNLPDLGNGSITVKFEK